MKGTQLIKLCIVNYALCINSAFCVVQKPVVTLQHLWDEAQQNSLRIKAKQGSLRTAEQEIQSARSGSLPDVEVSLSAGLLSDGVIMNRHFGNAQRVENPHFMNSFAIKASQLIYGGGAVKNSVQLAETLRDMAVLDLESESQQIKMMIAGLYLDLCRLYNQDAVLDDNLKLCNTLIDNMKVMAKEGTALSNDILRYELQKESILLAKRRVSDGLQIVYRQIATVTGRVGDNDFAPDTAMISQTVVIPNLEDWQTAALQGNTGIKSAAANSQLKATELKISRSAMLPKVAVVAEEHLDGPITHEVPVINSNFNYMFVGVGVQYSLSSLYKDKRNVRRAEIELDNAEVQHSLAQEQVSDAIFAAYTDFLTSEAEILTQQKSVDLANKNYGVILSRYNNGLATITDMLDAANVKLDAELSLVNSKINRLYNYFKLKFNSSEL